MAESLRRWRKKNLKQCPESVDHYKEPYAWMRYVIEQLPTCESAEQIEQLLPWNCEPPIYR